MVDELRERIAAYLEPHRVCIISTQGTKGPSAVLARYHLAQDAVGIRALQVDCLLPRWADAIYHLDADPELLLTIPNIQGDGLAGSNTGMRVPRMYQRCPISSLRR